jgi:thioesterase domain-containing protein
MVFILPGIDDNLEIWKPLQEVFDSKIVDYLDWTELLVASLADLAAHIVAQIKTASPSGDIRLVGYSIGGSLGYAVARELQAAGRQVACLVFLDASANVDPAPKSVGRRLRERTRQILTLASLDGMGSLLAKALTLQPALPLLRRLSRRRSLNLPLRFDAYLHRKITIQLMRRLYWPWWRATLQSASPLMTPAFLFRSQEHELVESEDLGWSNMCKNLTVIHVPGSHEQILDPENAEVIRARLRSIFHAQQQHRQI